MKDEQVYLNRKQASAYLGMCLRAVDTLLAEKRLPYSKIGKRVLIRREDLDALVKAARVEAA